MTFEQIIGAVIIAAPLAWVVWANWPDKPNQANSVPMWWAT